MMLMVLPAVFTVTLGEDRSGKLPRSL